MVQTSTVAATALAGAAALTINTAFVSSPAIGVVAPQRSAPAGAASEPQGSINGAVAGVIAVAGMGMACRAARQPKRAQAALVACRAQGKEVTVGDMAQTALSSVAAAALVAGSLPDTADAYPIFAQQNYANPEEATGKLACANCHLQGKPINVRMPQAVLPDTIFKTAISIPAKYEKRRQPAADGSKAAMNVGAIAVMPEGWKLAPKKRLPKVLKKQMKGLAWAPYSKEKPNIVVAGPVPGETFGNMVLPILAPNPETDKDITFTRYTFAFGGNRGRGQVYPEGNLSNNNQYFAAASGKVSAIDGLKVTVTAEDGTTATTECGAGADIVVELGEEVLKGDPITTNPNVGGFGQAEREMTLQDMNRVYAYCAIATSFFIAQLSFVLKKKQFEKVQLAEGF